MLLPPDKDEVCTKSVKAWRDIDPLTPRYEIIHLNRNDDDLRTLCHQPLTARIYELAPVGKRPREVDIVSAGHSQTAELLSRNGGPGQIAFHGRAILWETAGHRTAALTRRVQALGEREVRLRTRRPASRSPQAAPPYASCARTSRA